MGLAVAYMYQYSPRRLEKYRKNNSRANTLSIIFKQQDTLFSTFDYGRYENNSLLGVRNV